MLLQFHTRAQFGRLRARMAGAVMASVLLALGPNAATQASADDADARQKRYEDCITLARTDAEASRREAARWEAIGGGAQARHCAAVSLIALGAPREAAEILTEIGSRGNSRLGADDRVSMLSLAGELWLQLGQHQLAKRCFEVALKIKPSYRTSLIGAAHAAAGLGDHAAAEKHLTNQLKRDAKDVEALTFRASALRLQGKPKRALADATSATKLFPDNALAWFEKGAAERALGQDETARKSWLNAAMLDLVGQVGDDARHGLAILDAGG